MCNEKGTVPIYNLDNTHFIADEEITQLASIN